MLILKRTRWKLVPTCDGRRPQSGASSCATAVTLTAGEEEDLGVVEAPLAGTTVIPLDQVPAIIRHTASVAFKAYDNRATITSAQIDLDEVEGVYEIKGRSNDGRFLEADILPSGKLVELEIEVQGHDVPNRVQQALRQFAPQFQPATERPSVEKSVRPSATGLPEIWYEYSGVNFDVEIRSDGKAIVIEPA